MFYGMRNRLYIRILSVVVWVSSSTMAQQHNDILAVSTSYAQDEAVWAVDDNIKSVWDVPLSEMQKADQ